MRGRRYVWDERNGRKHMCPLSYISTWEVHQYEAVGRSVNSLLVTTGPATTIAAVEFIHTSPGLAHNLPYMGPQQVVLTL